MTKILKVFSLLVFTIFLTLPSLCSANSASPWYWISSDQEFSKFYNPSEVKVIQSSNGIPTLIQDYIKTGYSPGGAAATIKAMKLNIKNPNDLSYSIAKVWVNPQNRTIRYMEEVFYNAQGKALYKNIPANPLVKSINSQAYDEKFYTYIVDKVYHQGETAYLKSPQRWLTIWDNSTGDNAADTSTMYQVRNNVTTWLWNNVKVNGAVKSIVFTQKEYDLKNRSLRTLHEDVWTPDKGWQTTVATPDTRMRVAKAGTKEGLEYDKIRAFALRNPAWTYRYQEFNPSLKKKPHYAVDNTAKVAAKDNAKETVKEKAKAKPAPVAKTKATTSTKVSKTTTVAKETKPAPANTNSNAPAPEEPLGSYGPIGPVAS